MQPCSAQINSIRTFALARRIKPLSKCLDLAPNPAPECRGFSMSSTIAPAPLKPAPWRTPIVLIAVGCAIALIAFGPRSALGQFLSPMSFERGWGREVFSFAIALQNLLWGAAQPFAGAIADRFGPVRVLSAGAMLYALGLVVMATRNRR